MENRNRFKSWLHGEGPRPPLGSWLMAGAPATAEALGWAGFDFLVVDMEHVPIGVAETVALLRAIAGTSAEAVVRLPWNDQLMVKSLLDAGARSLMFPFIQTAEEARAAVAYTRYPPDGVRGVAVMHRGSRYGTAPDYLKTAAEEIAVILQLETPEAVSRLAEIAAVPGVDALFVGPGDLSAALGRLGEVGHPDVQSLIEQAAVEAKAVGRPIGIVGANPEMVARFLGYGYDFVAVSSDLAMMTGRAAEWTQALRGGGGKPAAPAGPY